MPLTGEAKKEYNKKYRDKYKETVGLLESLAEKDQLEGGKRYKSEALSYEELGKIYLGQPYKDLDIDEDEEEDDDPRKSKKKKDKKKKSHIPNPFKSDIMGAHRTYEEWLELRDRARKDLFWLGTAVLKFNWVEETHQVVCRQFVGKDFDGMYHEGYTLRDVHEAIDAQKRFDINGLPTKEAIILDSRGFYKSTIDCIDCIQWMLNAPDICILILTGVYHLAKKFMQIVKGCLCLPRGKAPTDFHLLFPEYVLRGLVGNSNTPFVLGCRKHSQGDPTLGINSIESNLAGFHSDVLKCDDVVTEDNCTTPESREILNDKIDGTTNILVSWGFLDIIGTRYYGDPVPDWYGARLKKATEENAIQYFCRGAFTVKPEFTQLALKELTEDMVILTFPKLSKRPFADLRKKLLQNETLFRCQQLNEPAGDTGIGAFRCSFDEDTLRRHLYQKEAAPQNGEVFICWDWAPTNNKRSDYSAGAVGRVYVNSDGRASLVILEVVCDKWTQHELAFQIVSLNKKWNPKKTLIEKSMGADALAVYLYEVARKYGTTLDIFWRPPSTEAHAKSIRIKGLEILIKEDRLWFVNGVNTDLMFKQFENYTGDPKNRGRHDDIPDAISYFPITFFPLSSMTIKEAAAARVYLEEEKKKAQIKAQYDRIFGKQPSHSIINPPTGFDGDSPLWKPVWPTKKTE